MCTFFPIIHDVFLEFIWKLFSLTFFFLGGGYGQVHIYPGFILDISYEVFHASQTLACGTGIR